MRLFERLRLLGLGLRWEKKRRLLLDGGVVLLLRR